MFSVNYLGGAQPTYTFNFSRGSAMFQVPAHSLPPDAIDVHLLRVVVRLDLSRRMIDVLLRDLLKAWDDLAAEQPTRRAANQPDLWTAPDHAGAHSKQRTRRTG